MLQLNFLQQMKILEAVQIYQYTDYVLIEGAVRTTAQDIWNKLNDKGIEMPLLNANALLKRYKPGGLLVRLQSQMEQLQNRMLHLLVLLKRKFKRSWVL